MLTAEPHATILSLHVHGDESGGPMIACALLHLVAGLGIEEDHRYFARKSRVTGKPRRRQVTLIDRETISEHGVALGLPSIAPGRVKSNIETIGINLIEWLGREVLLGTALVRFYEPRTPCQQMDTIGVGLRALMKENRQGVVAEVLQSGVVRVGDTVRLRPFENTAAPT